jgi:hypothetical protein
MTDASMDLWAAKSPLPSWWNAALLPVTNSPIVTASPYGSQGVLGGNWNTIVGMELPYYVTQGIPGNIAATGISEYGDVGVDYRNVYYDANGNLVLAATAPVGTEAAKGTGVVTSSNAVKYIIYITIAAVVLIILYKIFHKSSAPTVQYVQTAPAGGGDE